jgi:WD40 repeat protein
MAYDAFVSYSHAADDELAPHLQDALGRFAKPWWKRRALDVFRDRTGLSANPGLWSSITATLDGTEWFVLLASPDAAASEWVNREIDYWVEHKGADHLLPVVTDGEWAWDTSSNDFDWARCTAVPPALRGVYAEEPRHLDMRWARTEGQLSLRNGRFRDQVAELAAPIRGVTKDALEGADLREHRRTRRMVVGVGVLLVMLTVASIIGGVSSSRAASRADRRAEDATFGRLVAQARELRSTDPSLAMLLAREASDMRDNAESQSALAATLFSDLRYDGIVHDPDVTSGFNSFCLLADERTVVASGFDGLIGVYDVETRSRRGARFRISEQENGVEVECSPRGEKVVAIDDAGHWASIDVEAAGVSSPSGDASASARLAISPDDQLLAIAHATGAVELVPFDRPADGRTVEAATDRTEPAFSPDSTLLSTAGFEGIDLWDVATLDHRLHLDPPATISTKAQSLTGVSPIPAGQAFSPDGEVLVVSASSTLRLVEVGSGRERWAVPTWWYGGSDVTFTTDGRLFANVVGGLPDERSLDSGAELGGLTNVGANAVRAVAQGRLVVLLPLGGSTLSLMRLDQQTPLTEVVDAPGWYVTGYNQLAPGTLLLQTKDALLFAEVRSYDIESDTAGPALPAMAFAQPVSEFEVAGLLESSLQIGFFDRRTGLPTRQQVAIPLADATGGIFDPVRRHLAVSRSTGVIDLYDENGAPLAEPWAETGGFPQMSRAISDDGWMSAWDGDVLGRAYVLKSDGEVAYSLEGSLISTTLSRDGSTMAAVAGDGTIAIFDGRTGRATGVRISVPPGVNFLQFSEDATRLVAQTASGAVLIDMSAHQVVGAEIPADGGWAFLRPDGQELAVTTDHGAVLLDLDTGRWRAAACMLAGRNFTRAEWEKYMSDAGEYRATCSEWAPAL